MTWYSGISLFLHIGESISLLVLGTMWARRTKVTPVFRPLVAYLWCDSFFYVFNTFAKKVLHNNIFGFHISTFSDVTWLTVIFISLASDSTKNWLKTGWLLFFASAIISAIWVDGFITNINTLSRTVGNCFLVFMAFRQLNQMIRHDYLIPPFQSPVFIFCFIVGIYYSSSLLMFIGQDLSRYSWLSNSIIHFDQKYNGISALWFYPFLRALQFGLLLHLITLFPMGVTPRHALPRWLRFRLGWRPPTKNWRYRVLPLHLVG
ncbi:hypothetical protein [Hymenobacter psychrophilus]|uniref:Uncharacterized protein n=1 Tax=Hymenobacter psychrophilus TaxID=651662 RepID=A0A1H3GWU0_9BACT|nr:hypothetical protein [Hymenobacter psychrophilus]SDY07752.1 hypothetical protein SAMN04488069_105204 [Hymenobacter psychrophilus]